MKGGMADLDLEWVLQRRLELLRNTTLELVEHEHVVEEEMDSLFLILMSVNILLMQCGFACLEAGAVRNGQCSRPPGKLRVLTSFCRSKNTVNILIKNMLDAFIGATSYWAIGWGLAYGPGGNYFCGGSQYLNFQMDFDLYPKWFFQVSPYT